MREITVERGGVRAGACPECGLTAAIAHGYLYANDDAHAIYFLDWCEHHKGHGRAFLTLALGDWSGGATGAERAVVCLEIGVAGLALTDHPCRERPAFFGRFLPRAAALCLVEESDLWQLAERILADDPQGAAVVSRIRSPAGSGLETTKGTTHLDGRGAPLRAGAR